MQFVEGGPDIPERLLQYHEDGRVVFFCGAGISCHAELPTFSELVKQLYVDVGVDPDPVETEAIQTGHYDTAVGLLEAKIQGGRQTVRKKLADILTPNLNAWDAMATHEALLTLGKNREGRTRLITTNFDRLFEEAISKMSRQPRQVERFSAPLLPVPKKRWDGLVYLHGLLTENPSESDLEKLVVSSGDFGLAYLTERWAAQFVSELLRNFVVCFVGYSINDQVMRYMMDALAADRLLGESPLEMFAFESFSKGKEENVEREWKAKNVTPILYRKYSHHAFLHRTLRAWSGAYRDGAWGKVQIVDDNAMAHPFKSTEQDDFVGRMIWALSDPSGHPAKCFAECNPVPSLEWLEPLSEERFRHGDLACFNIVPKCWDKVMAQIAQWLTRHLDDPELLLWFAKRGSVLHEKMVQCIESKLKEINELEQNNQIELEQIRANAPNAIPRPKMRTLWQLLLKGRVRARMDDSDFYQWCEQFRRDGLTVILRFSLREKLMPCVLLDKPFAWSTKKEDKEAERPGHMSELVKAEVVLSSQGVRRQLKNFAADERWAEALPELLNEFSSLLLDALDLMRELGQADERSDQSYRNQPSISEHPQNRGYQDWTVLIELIRDAWIKTCVRSPEKARTIAEGWLQVPYPVFRRLALFAAAQDEIIPRCQALNWLLSDECWWLWSPETLRESMRLLVALAPGLQESKLARVEKAILAGPPCAMSQDDMDWQIWLRLAKIAENGARLSAAGVKRMGEISAHYPNWQLPENERDEFPLWIEEMRKEDLKFVAMPRKKKDLIEWLKLNIDNDPQQPDNWSERCLQDFDTTSSALSELAKQEIWPRPRWREALQAWTQEKLLERSWGEMAPIVTQSSDEVLHALSYDISRWLCALAKKIEGQEATFLALCDRLFNLEYEEEEEVDDSVQLAINHPVGRATDALLQWWYRRPLRDDQGLDGNLTSRFSSICKPHIRKFRHGRVLLAAHVITLFRVDRDWVTEYVLPLFEWERSKTEASAAWQGFLWSPRLYPPLVEAFKPAFLNTADYYEELGRYGVQYSSLLTFAAMGSADTFTQPELARATAALSKEGLSNVAQTLVRVLEGAKKQQRAEYWKNRVKPYLKYVWPKTQRVASVSIAESFARLCVAAEGEFPAALEEVYRWLQEVPSPDHIVHFLHEAKLHEQFPEATLKFLGKIIGENAHRLPEELEECLRTVRAERPALETDSQFQRLVEYLRNRGRPLD